MRTLSMSLSDSPSSIEKIGVAPVRILDKAPSVTCSVFHFNALSLPQCNSVVESSVKE